MKVRLWGTRGSLPTPGPGTASYGGNTSCVEVRGQDQRSMVILDAGTGICALGDAGLAPGITRVDILLTHLHMDHILGLGFFAGLFDPALEVHIWGPSSPSERLHRRLSRYLSPPLFPVRLRDLPCQLTLHDIPIGRFEVPGMVVDAALICHPGPTVGIRLDDGSASVAYIPDHEPALGARSFPDVPDWTSGYSLAEGVDLLIHDSQYDDDEYPSKIGWGHSSISHAMSFARSAGVGLLVPFHHDPHHDDVALSSLFDAEEWEQQPFKVEPAKEGAVFEVERVKAD
jgi:ribonuclease BN (tRNA processing enzyme)